MVTFALACVFRTDDKLHLTAALDALGGLQHEVKRDITFESCPTNIHKIRSTVQARGKVVSIDFTYCGGASNDS